MEEELLKGSEEDLRRPREQHQGLRVARRTLDMPSDWCPTILLEERMPYLFQVKLKAHTHIQTNEVKVALG